MLAIENLHVSYGGIKALRGININIEENKIVTLIGANGAGKSSTLRAIMNLVKKEDGKVEYDGDDLTNLKTMEIVKKGIALSPEGRRVFANLTVEENLILGAYTRRDMSEIKKDIDKVYNLFPRLKERSWQKSGTLSGGEQQMLAVGRALMIRPKVLMLDEPSLGLAPLLVKDIFDIIKEIHSQGNTILLVEQNAKKALEIADYAYVLETGSLVLEGPGQELLNDEKVKAAYLGEAK
ncbi:amino acid/amide ABC transporter ATP-binding protein 2, HAAT family (TC 3.A.1.4.-) [Tissierella praeacuta DSM 18095]|uniref:Amino acid/amide ABC transporter ATP-binding protein 2, HAAT family (TC 3.A.1.4.-) n=1 Tax=Tissierella praeacuta DSM 18095 TaxID=1123404 RepID=A0A1M4WL78_9FIRM|nr:ABC transporter ATP-binding protein [Tissierella praeacuta]TCU79112.1 amino acid/amide ABC transporter ATP-binding protein 2 (HAAT family) [Tissierella praeacuta]SHE81813.1 amino acid/amide ABC transporter ATP-binding protein 2, HAAT family (TC 3.A.1.4.-) [Tissierella praeacuta DSM 18095]SUO99340.1 LIV-I protein F [Tissierella praeacuta]HAE92823.1 ABC transporter ATP-binding protein [Tissierella sp.]